MADANTDMNMEMMAREYREKLRDVGFSAERGFTARGGPRLAGYLAEQLNLIATLQCAYEAGIKNELSAYLLSVQQYALSYVNNVFGIPTQPPAPGISRCFGTKKAVLAQILMLQLDILAETDKLFKENPALVSLELLENRALTLIGMLS